MGGLWRSGRELGNTHMELKTDLPSPSSRALGTDIHRLLCLEWALWDRGVSYERHRRQPGSVGVTESS